MGIMKEAGTPGEKEAGREAPMRERAGMLEHDMEDGLGEIRRAVRGFLEAYGEKSWDMILKEPQTAEERLRSEVVYELIEKLDRVSRLICYLGEEVSAEGELSRAATGEILLGGKALKPGQEIEVCACDPVFMETVWTRARVTAEPRPRLLGIGRDTKIEGLKARVRGTGKEPEEGRPSPCQRGEAQNVNENPDNN